MYWIKLSRPRFWLYLAGTYLVGYTVAAQSVQDFFRAEFLVYMLFFIFPANLFLYGVNDFFDNDTDQFNPKKRDKETHVEAQSRRRKILQRILLYLVMFSIALVLFEQNQIVQLLLMAFMLLSLFYSAPPLRFKARPIIDFASNVLYILPGVIAYTQLTGYLPGGVDVLMFALWTWAMHLFSAVPDIEADTKAGLKTSAILFGKRWSLYVCLIFWIGFSGLLVYSHPALFPFSLLSLLYAVIPLLLIAKPKTSIDRVYWFFPYMNAGLGFIAFMYFALKLF